MNWSDNMSWTVGNRLLVKSKYSGNVFEIMVNEIAPTSGYVSILCGEEDVPEWIDPERYEVIDVLPPHLSYGIR